MALIKEIESKYGDIANYWKIIGYDYDLVTDYTTIKIAIYLNKNNRKNKKVYIDIYPYQYKGEFNNKKSMYDYLKTLNEFKDSIDDLDD